MLEIWEQVLAENDNDGSRLMEILLCIQERCGCVTEACMKYLSNRIGIKVEYIFSMVTFYPCFSMQKQGKYIILVCGGTSCHLKKGDGIIRKLRSELGLPHNRDTTEDGIFTVRLSNQCLGACGKGPIIAVNGIVCPDMTPDKVENLLHILKKKGIGENFLENLSKECNGKGTAV